MCIRIQRAMHRIISEPLNIPKLEDLNRIAHMGQLGWPALPPHLSLALTPSRLTSVREKFPGTNTCRRPHPLSLPRAAIDFLRVAHNIVAHASPMMISRASSRSQSEHNCKDNSPSLRPGTAEFLRSQEQDSPAHVSSFGARGCEGFGLD